MTDQDFDNGLNQDPDEVPAHAPATRAVDFAMILASSVHDMKNSLGMLLNSIDRLTELYPPQDIEHAQQMSQLQYETSRINGELVQLLSLYRLQNDHLPVHVDCCFVSETIEDQIARNDAIFSVNNLRFSYQCDEDLSWFYDNDLVGGVIHNVLINAARYSNKQVDVTVAVTDDQLKIVISDDGPGYPQAMLDAPDNFKRGISFDTGSTNLGLYFAYHIAHLHQCNGAHGTIQLSNGGDLGGSIFTLILP